MIRRKDVGKQEPQKRTVSIYCDKVNKTVAVQVSELIDGWPQKIIWKKADSCNCNSECNPQRPGVFPSKCPAFKLEVKKN
jgi:hypothetical protein